MKAVFHKWPYGRFIEIQSNLRRKKLHRTNQGSNFLGGSFRNRDNVRAPIQFRRESQPQHLKRLFFFENRPVHFHVNSTSVIRPVKRNQLSFSSIEVNKPFLTPVHSISQIRFKFRSQFYLLPQIRCLMAFRIESSIISIDSNVINNIIRKIINVYQEKCRTNNGPLSNSSINWVFLGRFPIQNHRKPPITEKRRNKIKYLT